jgi:hypothetical protein
VNEARRFESERGTNKKYHKVTCGRCWLFLVVGKLEGSLRAGVRLTELVQR